MQGLPKKEVALILLYFILANIAVAVVTQYVLLGKSTADIDNKVTVTSLIVITSIILWFQSFALVYNFSKVTNNKKFINQHVYLQGIITSFTFGCAFGLLIYAAFYYYTDVIMTYERIFILPLCFFDFELCYRASKRFADILPDSIMLPKDEVEIDSHQQ